ncbi:MAG: SDR family oxidoreductase [Gammaproteobacteria bacterium]|nr:SDR family oxidoreductase [Gammaproteobacteria bacterium]
MDNKDQEKRKCVVVTGASRGIGAATAKKLGSLGYIVCINYLSNKAAAEDVAHVVSESGGKAFCVQGNVADESAVKTLFSRIDGECDVLHGLVNNAAILEPQMKLVDMTPDRIDRIFATNFRGSFLCCKEAIPRMSTREGAEGGVIVNVSSAAARLGSAGEYIDYAASKGAIDTLTIGLANELAPKGIRVNAVRPGFIETDMHASGGEPNRLDRVREAIPLRRAGKPEEIADAICWLLSPQSSYCTGSFIDIAGGR